MDDITGSRFDIEMQAEIVVALEKMFGVVRSQELPVDPAQHDQVIIATIPHTAIKVRVRAWYGSDWSTDPDTNQLRGTRYKVKYGEYWIEGTEAQLKNCMVYTTILSARLEIDKQKKIEVV